MLFRYGFVFLFGIVVAGCKGSHQQKLDCGGNEFEVKWKREFLGPDHFYLSRLKSDGLSASDPWPLLECVGFGLARLECLFDSTLLFTPIESETTVPVTKILLPSDLRTSTVRIPGIYYDFRMMLDSLAGIDIDSTGPYKLYLYKKTGEGGFYLLHLFGGSRMMYEDIYAVGADTVKMDWVEALNIRLSIKWPDRDIESICIRLPLPNDHEHSSTVVKCDGKAYK